MTPTQVNGAENPVKAFALGKLWGHGPQVEISEKAANDSVAAPLITADFTFGTASDDGDHSHLLSHVSVDTLPYLKSRNSLLVGAGVRGATPTSAIIDTELSAPSEVLGRGRITGPVLYFKMLLSEWGLEDRDAASLLGFEQGQTRDAVAILNGTKTLAGHDAKDRLRALINIDTLLNDMFRDNEVSYRFLRNKNDSLNASPLEMLLSGSMEKLLIVRDFVKHLAGV